MAEASKPARRKRTPRFLEIAEAAGVSPSTVDRVLNERGSVSPASRDKVIAAARQLGVPRLLPDTRHGLIHLDVLLPTNNTPFFQRLKAALQRSIQMLDRRIVVHRSYLPEDNDMAIAKAILQPPYRRQGLIITAPDTERVRDALHTVMRNGEPVVTMVTTIGDLEGAFYAGIDNYRAGRTAGYFLGRFARGPGRILILCSRSDYRGHMERARGCQEALEAYPGLRCNSVSFETRDDPDLCYLAVSNALKSGELIAGIYNTGAGSPGVEAALRKHGAIGKVMWVTHEISDDHRQYIENGALDLAIDQDPDGQAILALQNLLHACGAVEHAPLAQGPNEFRLYCRENLRKSIYLS